MDNRSKTDGDISENIRKTRAFRLLISDETFTFAEFKLDDEKPTGAQIAELVGAHPVAEFVVLQHLKSGELETLRPTEMSDLGQAGVEHFFVIRGSELYRFTLNGLSMEWPLPEISGKHVKILANVDEGAVLVLDHPQGDQVIDDGDKIILATAGVEEIRIRKAPKLVTVIYNQENRFQLERREYTTEELLKIFGVPSGYLLDLFEKSGLRELKPGEKTRVRDGIEFASHPPVGQSS